MKRHNRIDIELAQVLTPYAYTLLDRILFQSNLTKANKGTGFKFHVRKLAELTNISTGKVSELLKSWPFITKKGNKKDSEFTFHYDRYLIFIDELKNLCSPPEQHCSQDEQNCSWHEQNCSWHEPRQNINKIDKEDKTEPVPEIIETPAVTSNHSVQPETLELPDSLIQGIEKAKDLKAKGEQFKQLEALLRNNRNSEKTNALFDSLFSSPSSKATLQ